MRLIDDNGEMRFLDNRWLWPRSGAAICALMSTWPPLVRVALRHLPRREFGLLPALDRAVRADERAEPHARHTAGGAGSPRAQMRLGERIKRAGAHHAKVY